MRYKPEHKEQTHRRIVEYAAREFREHGFEGAGVAKIMSGLQLTHGGFYAHFASKEDLISESLALALDQALDDMLAALRGGGLPGLLDYYLNEGRSDLPVLQCPLPSLTAEVSRCSPATREEFTKRLSKVVESVAELLPGAASEEKQARVVFLLASMSGAVSLARSVSVPAMRDAVLDTTRAHLLALFDGTST